jgi:hypothetical protein
MGLGNRSLTKVFTAEREAQIARTEPGMAFFAGTGPFGKQCKHCKHLAYRRIAASGNSYPWGGCAMFKRLTGHDGPPVPKESEACKYFEQK